MPDPIACLVTPTHHVVRDLARAALYARGLASTRQPATTIGRITLLPHQDAAVQWLLHRIDAYGGALLADPPGLGKTYVALAVATARQQRPLVIAPAALRTRWLQASAETGVALDFISIERLSAPAGTEARTPALVIIDEAHHLRTATTRRYRRTLALCAAGEVLLLTATPIHNRSRDLQRITALFHAPATRRSVSSLRRLTLRRTPEAIHAAMLGANQAFALPAIVHRRLASGPQHTDRLPVAILALTPLLHDVHEGHALLQLGILHALRSSDAAARERIRQRIAGTLAIESAALAAVRPTAALRRAWQGHGGDVQLAMPQLLGSHDDALPIDYALHASRQRVALEAMLPLLDGSSDRFRARVLRRMARWSRSPVVAFTQFGATARALFRLLRHEPGIAMLTGQHARIASGVVSRADVLDRLLRPQRDRHQAVRLLIATDVLSEGLSLAGVATVVHLDVPWTAARLDQRVGRAVRIGAPVREVHVVSLPASLPDAVHHALAALVARKRRVMLRFEDANDAETTAIATLRDLAAAGPDASLGDRGWITMHSTRLRGVVTIAIVRVEGRRVLVACDDDGLRGVKARDWLALSSATAAPAVAGWIRHLRRKIAAHAATVALHRRVEDSADRRLLHRRLADEALLRGRRGDRLHASRLVTAQRSRVMRVTAPSALSRLHDAFPDVNDAGPERSGELIARMSFPSHRCGIRMLCGVVLLPAPAGP